MIVLRLALSVQFRQTNHPDDAPVSRQMSTTQSDTSVSSIRLKALQRSLNERAAGQVRGRFPNFVRDAVVQEAESTLLDTTWIELDLASRKVP